MSAKPFDGIWRRAFEDLHVAYLATLRIRHERRGDDADEIGRDMLLQDPFGAGDEGGADSVRKWQDIWEKHGGGGDMGKIMSASTEAIKNHWDSWADLTKAYPDLFKEAKGYVQSDEFMTSTTASRETMEARARTLREAWEKHCTGD
ncbi:MAG: hypothetical protein ACYTFG_10690 [Planctomycetota bacterium]|jgi:hypothetical protein